MNENKLLDDFARTPWRAQFHDSRHSDTSCGELRAPRWFRSSGPEPPGPSRSSVRRASVPAAKFVETVATLPGDLGLIPIAEALKSATSRTGGKSNVIARGPEPCSPGISRARSRIGPGYLATVSVCCPKGWICCNSATGLCCGPGQTCDGKKVKNSLSVSSFQSTGL